MCEKCIHYIKIKTNLEIIQVCNLVKDVVIAVHGELIVKHCNKFNEKS